MSNATQVPGSSGPSHGPPLSVSELRTSPRHALLRGLRWAGDEAQLTQVIADIAATDPAFGGCFVRLLVEEARKSPRTRAQATKLGRVPEELECRAEHAVYGPAAEALGRVDLRFDGEPDFTLFVENKLHSGFGNKQLTRYQSALAALPADRRRRGLIAVTRDVPSYGELNAGTSRWLGAVRWAKLLPGLQRLRPQDPDVAAQWPILLDILETQGDFGVTNIDAELFTSWARFGDARTHLRDVLDDIWQASLDVLRQEGITRYGPSFKRPEEQVLAPFTRGAQAKHVHWTIDSVYLAFRVPSRVERSAIKIMFWPNEGQPHFALQAEPWQARQRFERSEPEIIKASANLQSKGWETDDRGTWWADHATEVFLDDPDVPTKLLSFVAEDARQLFASGLLDHDVKKGRGSSLGGPPPAK